MTAAYTTALESLAEHHLSELEADAKANQAPRGMTVGVFDDGEFLGYGRVIGVRQC